MYQDVLPISDKLRFHLLVGSSAIRLQQNRYREAAESAIDAVKTKRPRARALYLLGLAFMRAGNSSGTIRAFQDFAKLQPHRVAPYRWLERLARDRGDDA